MTHARRGAAVMCSATGRITARETRAPDFHLSFVSPPRSTRPEGRPVARAFLVGGPTDISEPPDGLAAAGSGSRQLGPFPDHTRLLEPGTESRSRARIDTSIHHGVPDSAGATAAALLLHDADRPGFVPASPVPGRPGEDGQRRACRPTPPESETCEPAEERSGSPDLVSRLPPLREPSLTRSPSGRSSPRRSPEPGWRRRASARRRRGSACGSRPSTRGIRRRQRPPSRRGCAPR